MDPQEPMKKWRFYTPNIYISIITPKKEGNVGSPWYELIQFRDPIRLTSWSRGFPVACFRHQILDFQSELTEDAGSIACYYNDMGSSYKMALNMGNRGYFFPIRAVIPYL